MAAPQRHGHGTRVDALGAQREDAGHAHVGQAERGHVGDAGHARNAPAGHSGSALVGGAADAAEFPSPLPWLTNAKPGPVEALDAPSKSGPRNALRAEASATGARG
ncbi:MAG TPA: hypothetical protein VFQ35_09255, partial [Polyangiaceae bacterium]|nr:hypothetical protein [Polyangiaceae bacterium]